MDPAGLDVLVVGSGVAGLSAAVRLAASEGVRVGVLTKASLDQSATRWAQGGVAAVLDGDEDSTDLHLADTLAAGAGLCDPEAVRVLVDEGPGRVNELIGMGAVFDRYPEGGLARAREGGHSMARVLHAGGAATGAEIERALVDAVRATAAALMEGWFACDLVVEAGRCRGVVAVDEAGARREVRAGHVILATGGAGQLFSVTTNPSQATGDGVALALRAGVAVADVEFMQFHPTALHHPAMPRPLLSEALRGHGALLRDSDGQRFIEELSPRDVVSRAMTARMIEAGVDHLWLDATGLESFAARFPTIARSLSGVGLDPARDWLPIAPAAHYLSGGVVTDLDGSSSLPGLWAAGETACTGVHGANRLASNSLLEGMVFGPRVVEAIAAGVDGPRPTGAMRSVLGGGGEIGGRPLPLDLPGGAGAGPVVDVVKTRDQLQRRMTMGAGVLRSAASLEETADHVAALVGPRDQETDSARLELANLATVAWALLRSASARTESRGAHTRTDYPDTDPAQRHRLVFAGVSGPFDPPRAAVSAVVAAALAEDLLPLGDITASLIPSGVTARAAFTSRETGVLAGTLGVVETFAQLHGPDGPRLSWARTDGDLLEPGTVIATVEGRLAQILTAERTSLNLLSHLSGVASATRGLVDAVAAVAPSCRIRDTRKTTPGLRALEKAAVRAGGGHNHRANLSEAVLVKDNHLGGLSITDAVVEAHRLWPGRHVEVECDGFGQLEEALAAGADMVMLDNMSPAEAAKAVELVRAHGASSARGPTPVEVSGRITLESAAAYALAGVDFISVGFITHSAPVLDIGLDLSV